ncbi:MAG: hypothetical protein AAFQ02_04000 [Bacteroidota bacterium]
MRAISMICLLCVISAATAQRVTVSPDITLRNLRSYDIIGDVNGTILLYRDKGNEQEVSLYDENLVFQSDRDVNLLSKRATIYEIVNLDTAFGVIYGYREEDNHVIQMDIMNERIERVDSVTMAVFEKEYRGLEYSPILSEDQSVISLYNFLENDRMKLITYDFDRDTLVHNDEYIFTQAELFDEVVSIDVSDDGHFYMLSELDNSRARRKDHKVLIYHFAPLSTTVTQIEIPLEGFVSADVMMSIHNPTGKIGVVGLYDEKRFSESTGYFWISALPTEFDQVPLQMTDFSQDIFFELYGEKRTRRLENFGVSDVFWNIDGDPILSFEMMLDVSRRTGSGLIRQQTANQFYDANSNTAWSDHYREDILLIALDENLQERWHRVFYKRQFSQNDDASFSSYFPFMTPSRMRLIYNDEIKNNSTVSEYILDPNGNYKRTSVLSTEYQNLKLRFRDAEQISSTEMIVPSQKNYLLNLVKIDFSS